MDEKTVKSLAFDIKKEALERGHTLTMPTVGKSMFPLLMGKDRIVISRCDYDKLRCGDLILYRSNKESNVYVSHRIMREIKSADGLVFITKGDAHFHCDRPVNSGLLIGKITNIYTPYFNINLESILGRIINGFMFLISQTRIIGFGLWVLRKIKIVFYKFIL